VGVYAAVFLFGAGEHCHRIRTGFPRRSFILPLALAYSSIIVMRLSQQDSITRRAEFSPQINPRRLIALLVSDFQPKRADGAQRRPTTDGRTASSDILRLSSKKALTESRGHIVKTSSRVSSSWPEADR
jgi:hypothetical protein